MSWTGRGEVKPSPSSGALFLRALLRSMLGVSLIGAILLFAADDAGWWGGIRFIVALLMTQVTNAAVLSRVNPRVLALRLSREMPQERWDIVLFSVLGSLALLVLAIAGLDHRFGWASPLPAWTIGPGALSVLAGDVLFVWTLAVNPFFSKFILVQGRGVHRVVRRGPYRWIRHPGYLGWLLVWLGLVVFLGSVIALALAALAVPLVAIRALLEERVLEGELEGYSSYVREVRFRLVPGIW
jgi:protein-S-isoprenylcysteine O-methyltransferase Ste14